MLNDRSCVCEWCNQYYMTAEEREYFWERIPCQLHDNSRHSHQKGNNLYNMKSYVWPMGTEVFFFKIGLNPLRSFQVEIILEKENQTEYVGLDGTTVNELFSTIKKLYRLNVCYPGLHTDNASNTENVEISVYNCNLYSLSIKKRSMRMNDKNLLALVDLQPWITEILQMYEFERIKAESSLFTLLEVFAKKIDPPQSSELIELIATPCLYMPIAFIIEMATQHFSLLLHLLAVYQDRDQSRNGA